MQAPYLQSFSIIYTDFKPIISSIFRIVLHIIFYPRQDPPLGFLSSSIIIFFKKKFNFFWLPSPLQLISHIYKLYTKPISQSCGSRNVKSCWMLVPASFNFKSSSSTVFASPPNFQSSTMTQAYIRLIVVRKHVNHHITKGQILLPAYIRLMFCKRQLVFFFLACYISSEYF